MQRKDLPQAEQYIRRCRCRRIWKRVMGGLVCAAVCVTLYMLARPGFTMEAECEIPEHTHTDSCYQSMEEGSRELICGMEEHVHDDNCVTESMTAAESGSKAEPQTEEEKTLEEAPEETPEEEKAPEETPEEEKVPEETPEEEKDKDMEQAVPSANSLQETTEEIQPLADVTEGEFGEGLFWKLEGDTLTISGNGKIPNYSASGSNTPPWYSLKDTISKVVIEEGVTDTGNYTFYDYTGITSVTLPAALERVGNYSFYGCTSLEEISLPDTVLTIGAYAFYGCSALESITLPRALTMLSDRAFADCSSLSEVTLRSEDLETVYGSYTFLGCTSLKKLTVDNTVKTLRPGILKAVQTSWFQELTFVGENTFEYSGSTFTFGDTKLISGYSYKVNADGSLQNDGAGGVCGENVTWYLSGEGKLILSGTGSLPAYESVDQVPWYSYFEEITSVEIQAGVSGIDGLSFALCPSLQEITAPEGENQQYLVEDGVLFQKDKSVLITCLPTKAGSYTVPSTVERIESFAFAGCGGLTTVTVPENVTEVKTYAFAMSGLTEAVIPDSIQVLEAGLFTYCTRLQTVTLPQNLKEIGESTFSLCTKLKSISLPSSLETIGTGAFMQCVSLTEITIPDGVTSLPNNCFAYCEQLQKVGLPEGVTAIGSQTFYGCKGLTGIELPDSITEIGNYAFRETGLTEIALPESVTAIPEGCFYGCASLGKAELPSGLREIGADAFYNSGLAELSLPEQLTAIGNEAFRNCSALKSVTLYMDAPVTIGNNVFRSCSSLKSVTVDSRVKKLDGNLFAAMSSGSGGVEEVIFLGPNTFTHTGASLVIGDVELLSGFTYTVDAGGNLERGDASGTCGEQVSWTLDDSGKLTISGTGPMEDFATVYSAPWAQIADEITSVEVQEGVTGVGQYAFANCPNLTKAVFADSVASLGERAFYGCSSLKDVKLSEKLTEIGNSTFQNCSSLMELSIPEGVERIPSNMFYGCTSLSSVTIPASVKEIGSYAFYNCQALTNMELPSALTEIGSYAFYQCSSLEEITIPDGVSQIENYTFQNCSSLKKLTLGAGLESVGNYAFRYCSALNTVVLRMEDLTGLVTDSTGAFSGCSGLGTIVFENTVKTVDQTELYNICYGTKTSKVELIFHGPGSFTYTGSSFTGKNVTLTAGEYTVDAEGRLGKSGVCDNGLTWRMDPDGTLTISGNGTMKDFSYTGNAPWYKEFGSSIKKLVIEEGVQSVGDYAFDAYPSLEEISLPQSLTRIGGCAFRNCTSLKAVTIPDSVKEIGSYAFEGAEKLEQATLPEGLTEISTRLFYNCESLQEITIPESVTSVGYDAFGSCTGLKKVILKAKEIDSYYTALSSCTAMEEIIIANTVKDLNSIFLSGLPEEVKLTFEGPNSFTYSGSTLTVGGRTLSRGEYEVDKEGRLLRSGSCGVNVSWTLAEDGTLTIHGTGEMDNYDYWNDTAPWESYNASIKKVVVEEGVTRIGDYAFYGSNKYRNLKEVQIAGSVQVIGEDAFHYCSSLENVTFEENSSLKEISDSAFSSTGLSSVVLPDSLEVIDFAAFLGTPLTSVKIPASVSKIGSNAFENCESLAEVHFAEGSKLTSLGSSAFRDTALAEIEIPETVETIGDSAFEGTKLTSVKIPASVESIGNSAFESCADLRKVTFEEGSRLTAIGDSAFTGTALTEIEIPETVETIGALAFEGTKLTSVRIPAQVKSIGAGAFRISGLKAVEWNAKEAEAQGAFSSSVEQITVGSDTEQITHELMVSLGGEPSRLTDIQFEINDGFAYSGEDYLIHTPQGDILFTDGVTYLADKHGRLTKKGSCKENLTWTLTPDGVLRIDGAGAMQDYIDGTGAPWHKYTEEIKKAEIGAQVTHLGSYAFADCPNLSEVNFDEESVLDSIGSYAFAGEKPLASIKLPESTVLGAGVFQNCTELASVNGETSLKNVIEKWKTGIDVFYRTKLWEGFFEEIDLVDSSTIQKIEENERTISLRADEERDKLTGQTGAVSLTVSGGEGNSQTAVRVYFAFDNENGSINYKPGEYEFDGIEAEVCETAIPNVYYLEIPNTNAGDTLNVTINSVYDNFTEGGTAFIWLSLLDKETAESMGNQVTAPESAFIFTWTTRKNEFEVTKTSSASPKVTGDGTADGELTVKNLWYSIAMTKTENGESSDYGKDIVTKVRFVDTLTLPEHFSWRDGILKAVKEGRWSVYNLGAGYDIMVQVGETSYWLGRLMMNSGIPQKSLDLRVSEDNQLEIIWEYRNSSSTSEISNKTVQLSFGEDVILADRSALEEAQESGEAQIYSFLNQVVATQTYAFSEEVVKSAEASPSVVVGSAGYELGKTRASSGAVTMGEEAYYTVSLTNNTVLPYTSLDYVEDPLNDYFYIKPADMEHMLKDEENGKLLTITLENATLCTPVEKTITAADGKEYTVTQQQVGENTEYNGEAPESPEDTEILAGNVTIAFGWAENQEAIQMKVSGAPGDSEQTYTIGSGADCDYADIETALNEIGYLIDLDVTYCCRWSQQGETLYSGEKKEFQVRSTTKDSFMRLNGDLPWYIKDNLTYNSQVGNTARSVNTAGEEQTKTVTNLIVRRDFEMYKSASWNDMDLEDGAAPDLKDGDVITYYLNARRYYSPAIQAPLPLTDSMEGPQALLAEKNANTALSDKELETRTVGNTEYYVFSKPGEYENISIDGYIADTVTVTKTEGGLSTLIRWYCSPGDDTPPINICYRAVVMGALNSGAEEYNMRNEVWLGGRERHRLYDGAFFGGKRVVIEKHIVADMTEHLGNGIAEHDYEQDKWVDRSTVGAGDTVTYCLEVERTGITKGTIDGSSMQDYLPASLKNYWSKENVSVAYVAQDGMEMVVTNPEKEGWEIIPDSEDPNQQILKWKDDFSITLNGTVYIYVTLTFPKGEEWTAYTNVYGSAELRNTFHLDNRQDEVFHDLDVTSQVLLQKGVYLTGSAAKGDTSAYTPAQNADSLLYYANDGQDFGIVTYYIALYNSGESRMYLSGIQDVLPEGFTFDRFYAPAENIYSSTNSNEEYYDNMLTIGAENVEYKSALLEEYQADNGVVTFTLTGSGEESSIAYDESRERYYLDSGEAVVFAYNCRTNGYEDTLDTARNEAAMPYYDYNGAEYTLDETSAVERRDDGKGFHPNDGERYWLTEEQAAFMGMDTSGTADGTRWLSSSVTVRRGNIMPGISKTAEKSFADSTDEIVWTVRAVNSGSETMRDYTLTDVMQTPYQLVGAVELRLQPETAEETDSDYTTGTLFEFGERSSSDQNVTLKYRSGEDYSDDLDEEIMLTVGGEAVDIPVVLKAGRASVKASIQVSLSRDENGNEHLTLYFPEETAAALSLMPCSYAKLTLHTKNNTGSLSNQVYYNMAYLTPSEKQSFHKAGVTQGTCTLYDGKTSIVSEANIAVSYGYATVSEKSVTELNGEGDLTENTAGSNSGTNYIVLSEGTNAFRYTLTVDNTGGSNDSMAMKELILLDNLPEPGDHTTFYNNIGRFSEFQVNFAEEPKFSVQVNGKELDKSQYVLEYSNKTEFDEADRKGTSEEGWITAETEPDPTEMRSFRLKIHDSEENGAKILPANAKITVSFTAEVQGEPEPSMTAWNSFGYTYCLEETGIYLEASPQKVGVRIAGVPFLSKELLDSDGNPYAAPEEETFRFLLYEGAALEELEGMELQEAAERLTEEERGFTRIDLKIKKDQSETEEVELKDLKLWTWEGGEVKETQTAWKWKNLESYTLLELPLAGNSDYTFGSMNGYGDNNMTFAYQTSQSISLSCVNVRDVWTLQLFKQSRETGEKLSGAVFALYSPVAADQVSEEECEKLKTEFGLDASPAMKPTLDGTTWYLKDIRKSDEENGAIEWSGLTEERYYLLELRAPEGYKLDEQPGQEVKAPEEGVVNQPVVVANSGYEMPETGGPGTWSCTIGGAALTAGALSAAAWRRRKKNPGGA